MSKSSKIMYVAPLGFVGIDQYFEFKVLTQMYPRSKIRTV